MIDVYKFVKIWDHYPEMSEILTELRAWDNKITWRQLPEDKIELFFQAYGIRVYYNGSTVKPMYRTEVLFYYDDSGKLITNELKEDTPLFLI